MREPSLDFEFVLATTDQLTVLPEVETDAQGTLELAEAGGQSTELGVITIEPDEARAPMLTLVLLSA